MNIVIFRITQVVLVIVASGFFAQLISDILSNISLLIPYLVKAGWIFLALLFANGIDTWVKQEKV